MSATALHGAYKEINAHMRALRGSKGSSRRGLEEILTKCGRDFLISLFPNLLLLTRFRDILLEQTSRPFGNSPHHFIRVYVKGASLNVPWEFLYLDGSVEQALEELTGNTAGTILADTEGKIENFLGLSFFFQQVLAVREVGRPSEVPFDRSKGVELYFDADLNATQQIELPYIQETLSMAKVKWKTNDPITGPGADIYECSEFSERQKVSNADILHLACHAEDQQGGVVIRIADGYFFHNSALPRTLNNCTNKPFLFLNACELAVRSIPEYNGLLSSLHDAGVKAVLATEIEVADKDAAEFSSKVVTPKHPLR